MLRCDSPSHRRVWIVARKLGAGAGLVCSSLAAAARSAVATWGAASTAKAWHMATMYSAAVSNRSAIALQSVVSIQLSRSSAGGKEGVEIVILWGWIVGWLVLVIYLADDKLRGAQRYRMMR
jgi:hypothetical protein